MRVMFYSSLLVLLLLLTSCGGAAAPSAAQPTLPAPTSGAAIATAQPEPTAALAPTGIPATAAPTPNRPQAGADVLVTYRKTGGIAGLDETLIVHADGALEFQSRRGGDKAAQVTPAELGELAQLLGSPEFVQLQPRYSANGADLFTYSISLPGQSQPAVVTMDGAEMPPVLRQAIEALNQLAAQVK